MKTDATLDISLRLPKLYSDLADWWPLVSPPARYAEEAAAYRQLLVQASRSSAATLLELGSGGGNNASHLKTDFAMTLVDVSEQMLKVSRYLNPDCEHIRGDMRNIRLGREFDCVLIHDAISYMTTYADLTAAIRTAYAHCRPGGVALFVPNYISETFVPSTSHGGIDTENRGLRYLEWVRDPNPNHRTYLIDYAFLLRDENGMIRVETDHHVEGLFSRAEWLLLLSSEGFSPAVKLLKHSQIPVGSCEVFVAVR